MIVIIVVEFCLLLSVVVILLSVKVFGYALVTLQYQLSNLVRCRFCAIVSFLDKTAYYECYCVNLATCVLRRQRGQSLDGFGHQVMSES